MPVYDDDPGVVCRVLPDGDVICEKVSDTQSGPITAMMISADGKALPISGPPSLDSLPAGTWGPNKTKLAARLLEVLAQSDLPDDRVPRRSGEIVDSVKQLLTALPPSILLYNYSVQPANVMGAYYLNKADLVQMQRMYQVFSHPKEP
ncbi:MAG: hypothetical protein ABI120_24300 [Gemmatimonadaceae bacterium]